MRDITQPMLVCRLFPEERECRMKDVSAISPSARPGSTAVGERGPVPLLPEIRAALTRLWVTGQPTVFDLREAPLGPQDEHRLFEALQRDLATTPPRYLGSCRIRETAAPCVWIVESLDSVGDVAGKFIEINWCPGALERSGAETDEAPVAEPATRTDPACGT
jgi:hypothetical protein